MDRKKEREKFRNLPLVNVAVPRTLNGRGEVDLVLTADGKATNAVRVNLKQG